MATEHEHFNKCREFQLYYDDALRRVGSKAPAPVLGQKVNDYRRETLRTMKMTLPERHPLRQVNCRSLPTDALNVFEPQFLQARVDEAKNPENLAPGEIRKVEVFGPDSQKWIDWIGRESFVRGMTRPGRRVIGFRTPHGLEMTKT
jgi:hypothetical protein